MSQTQASKSASLNKRNRSIIYCLFLLIACLLPFKQGFADKKTEEAVEHAAEKAAQKAVEKVVEKAAAQTIETVAEKAVAIAVEQAAVAASSTNELKAQRPNEWKPTTIYFTIFVVDIDDIDDADQNFGANVYLRLRWKDERLANPEAATRQLPLEQIWNPRILVANRQGLVSKSLPDVVQVSPDGTVIYHQRYTGRLSQPLLLSDFPMDKHTFDIHFVAAGYSADQLHFIPEITETNNIVGGSIADQLSLQDWKIVSYQALALAYRPIKEINSAGCAFRFSAERYFAYYLWQIVLPLAVVVLMSCASFWFKPSEQGTRITIATSSVLTIITYRFVLASLLPRLPYMTRMDYFTVGCTLLVFMVLVTIVITSFLIEKRSIKTMAKVDYFARLLFPATFFAFLGWFIFL